MTEYKKVFVDTAPFIYYIEKDESNPQYFEKMKSFFMNSYQNNIKIVTSVITIEEYFVFPYKRKKLEYIYMFKKLIKTLGIELILIDEVTADEAAKIRAKYQHFKSMDSLQLASACLKNCDLFLTNDKQLKQFKEIKCMTLDDL